MSFYTPFAFVKSPTSAFVGLLDNFPGAFMAYSLRRLSGTYTGSAIQVIKVDNTTTQDIGFTANGSLDTATLSSFLGGGGEIFFRSGGWVFNGSPTPTF